MTLKLFPLIASLFFITQAFATNVKDYGAKGNGIDDDTEAIVRALRATDDGLLHFPKGRYRVNRSIEIDLSVLGPLGLSGATGTATLIMDGPGAAFKVKGSHFGSALPASVKDNVWQNERMFVVENIEIIGNHPEADGIELQQLMQPIVRGCLIRNVRHGILLTRRNRNVLIEGNHIYDCTGVGIYLDSVNIHQMIISHSHISYCQEAGIKVRSGEIRNFQITGNDIEYNCRPDKAGSADICIDLSAGGSVREGTITSNTIQAIESVDGTNIRFTGDPLQPHKLGLWSITGNHISNQQTCIRLENTRGISITGNTFIRAYRRHLHVENSKNVIFSANVIDHNSDYFPPGIEATGGIYIAGSEQILLHDNLIEGISGTPENAAIEVRSCREVSITNSRIINSQITGIVVNDSRGSVINGNTINLGENNHAAMSIKGDCSGSIISGNRIFDSKIVNRGSGVKIRK